MLISLRRRIGIVIIICTLFIINYLVLSYYGINFTLIKQYSIRLRELSAVHYLAAPCIYMATYAVLIALCLPLASILTLLSGFLFGTLSGALYTNIAAVIGATVCFLAVRYLIGRRLQYIYAERLAHFNKHLQKQHVWYLLAIRLVAFIPFSVGTILAGLTHIPIWTFMWTTSVGIIPVSLIFAYAGNQLASITSLYDIWSPQLIVVFVLLALLALLPPLIMHKDQT